jgi:hypothetical protein
MSRNHLWAWVGLVCLVCVGGVFAQQDQTASDGNAANSSAVAAVPRLIKFSGAVRDARGELLGNVAVRLTFAVYEEPQGGAALWIESQVAQLDEQGHYTVLLGATRADGLPVELFPAGKARWLGVQVEGRDEDARVLLVSVPYALKAEDAAMLGGRSAADFVLAEQLKEEVRTQVAAQTPGLATQAVEMLVNNPPNVPAIAEGPSTFTCATTSNCVTVQQTGTGRAMSASVNSSNEAILVQQSGTGYGLRALSPGNVALFGQVTGSAGTSYGVKGQTTSTTGAGVFGYNLATTGLAYGVLGQTASTEGTAFFGRAVATTGATIGLRGHADSTSGTGIMGQATATSGTTTGILARVFSVNGTALIVDNTLGGKLLSGQVNGTERFNVDGSGNLATLGTLSGTQLISTVASGTPPLSVISNTVVPNLNADLLDGAHASAFAPAVHGHLVAEISGAATTGANTFTGTQNISSGDLSVTSGDISLPETTSASAGVINLGGSAFIHAYGGNTFVGTNAGNFTTTGEVDTATGFMALNANTTGSWNTATGHQALQLNTAGSNNTATGGTALFSNTTGSENTATGSDALYYNTTGNFNTASAWRALHSNTTGYDNTASGVWALFSNTEGYRNTASGIWALYSNTTGNQNTADGTSALASNTTGNQNTASGWRALYSNTTGGNNTAVGRWSGYNNSTGSNNTFIGANAGPDSGHGDLTNATAIGAGAVVSQSNSLILGNGANVGIGTAAPAATLDVVGNIQSSGSVTATSFVGPLSGIASDLECVGCVSPPELNFDPATQTELETEATARASGDTTLSAALDAHKSSADHDGRYARLVGGNSFFDSQSVSGNVSVSGTGNFSGDKEEAILQATQAGSGPSVLGQNNSSIGEARGVVGQIAGGGGGGAGVYGEATAGTATSGVYGVNYSAEGAAVRADERAETGNTAGVHAAVHSPGGTAGVFLNLAGGRLLAGWVGDPPTTQVFRVEGSGNVWTSGSVTAASFSGDGSGLTNVPAGTASDLNCTGCVAEAELGFDSATQAELDTESTARASGDTTLSGALDTHKGSGDHDARYARLVGGNSFTGDQSITGNLTLSGSINGGLVVQQTGGATPNVIGGYNGNTVANGVSGATIGGGGAFGHAHSISVSSGTIGGGYSNTVSSEAATVAGGHHNTASGDRATIGGGREHTASGSYATVGGGIGNTASGDSSTVPGGQYNTAQGQYSFAAGRRAKANHIGAFVWGDSTEADVESSGNNQFIARAVGGVTFYTSTDLSTGVTVSGGGGSWSSVSDRNAKQNFAPVDGQILLARLIEVPVLTWNYKAQDPSIRHLGPMAQDFRAAFGLGEDDKHIATVDADGVALAAIQELYKASQEKDRLIKAQGEKIDQLTRETADLRARLARLEQAILNK